MEFDDEKYAKVQCITDLSPWAEVVSKKDGEPERRIVRALERHEVVVVPRDKALDQMKGNHHVVEVR